MPFGRETSGEVTFGRETVVQAESNEQRLSAYIEMRKAAAVELHDQ
jgi:hypothetical protein